MTPTSGRPVVVGEAIFVDEIGIEIGVCASAYRLKSAYQPIFSRVGDFMRPLWAKIDFALPVSGKPVLASRVLRRDSAT